ncbi:unnamed protein product [Mytilus coruscus]|uniref:BACK domain-containing protein n=1 Tax=Mytilus coruscus TaxID=42192 RepID=A0A6J8EYW9_MYTCO|nr:unnamed protein product [Mytilus coruscus]
MLYRSCEHSELRSSSVGMNGEMNCDRCEIVHHFPEHIRKHVVEVFKNGQVCKELLNYDNILLYLEVSCISRPLKTACEEKLLECIGVMNAIDALHIAEKYELLLLKKEAIQLIADHFKNLWHTDSFVFLHELSLERIFQVEKVFKHDDVFRALEKWLNWNHETRLKFYGKLLHLVKKQRSTRKYYDTEKTYHVYHAMITPSVSSKSTIEVAVFDCDGDLVCHKNLFKSHDVKDRFSVACAQKDETEALMFTLHMENMWFECSLVVLGDFLYALGGHHNGNNVLEIEELDTKHHRNMFLIKKSWKTIAHLPENVKLAFAPCVTYFDKIYIVAELLSNENIKSTGLLTFDPNEKSVEIVANFSKNCSDCRAVLYESKIFIASSEGYFLRFDIETKTCSSCKDIPTKGNHHGMYAARNKIYFVGASASDNDIERFEKDEYDIQTNSWKRERKLPCNLPIYGSCEIKVPSDTHLIPFDDSR